MAKASILSWEKKAIKELDLDANVFDKPVREDLLQTVVRWQLACRRQGTHATKTRGLVRGGGKKPFKQKGTGNARQGSSRSPLMPGGGTAFGPQVRSYGYALPRKVKQAGLSVALSYLHSEGRLFVVDNLQSDGKTAELAKRLRNFGVDKAVLVDEVVQPMMKRAAQNLPNFRYYSVAGLNVYDLLRYGTMIVTPEALARVCARCSFNKSQSPLQEESSANV